MTRPFYADYVNHCLRFYSREVKVVKVDAIVDIMNWQAVHNVLSKLPEINQEIIKDIYSRGDTLADNIFQVSKERELDPLKVWTMISKITKQIAKERELI